jgi:hypothetical protein
VVPTLSTDISDKRVYAFSLPLFDEVDTEVSLFTILSKYSPLIVSLGVSKQIELALFHGGATKEGPQG